MLFRSLAVILMVLLIGPTVPVEAKCRGLLGCAVDQVVPGAGTALDDAHDRLKRFVPPYKNIEEGGSEFVRNQFAAACAAPFQAVTGAVIARCSNWSGRMQDSHLIRQAADLLVSRGLMARDELSGVQVRWCQLNGAHGMAPDRGRIYLDASLKGDLFSTASTLAHELVHVRQYRRMGTDTFKCKYSQAFVACSGCQDRRNPFEREAYDFQERVEAQLSGTVGGSGTLLPSINPDFFVTNRSYEPFYYSLRWPDGTITNHRIEANSWHRYQGSQVQMRIQTYSNFMYYDMYPGESYQLHRSGFGTVVASRE